jgi:membrane protein DedA with SNARE-associated domain
MLLLVGLAASTLLSEDAACVAAGVLIQQGAVGPLEGVAACAAGIYVGDVLLWCVGRLARRECRPFGGRAAAGGLRRLRGCERLAGAGEVARLRRYAEGSVDSPLTLLASRFLPGTRLPLYLAAGAFGRRPRLFFLWTFVAVVLWTPLIVLGTASTVVGGLLIVAAVHMARQVGWRRLSARVSATIERWRRWEFWPSWILYAPVALHIMRLAWRHGGLGTLSAANPGIPDGGFAGESKFQILAQLPARWTLGALLVEPGAVESRVEALRGAVEARGLGFPLILKPDAGQRGVGVRLVHSLDEARSYFALQTGAVVAQRYHPGPFEAGIFYYRRPGDLRGRVFSLTDKRFPVIVGDGRATLEELIWSHPRVRLQAGVFLARHRDERNRVPADGDQVRLAVAGNHAQGTMFLDGRALITPALERRIDEIARHMPGFYIGRFDVRYADVEQFRAGADLAIVELNGVTSEATHIYDPAYSLVHAWRVLCEQWSLVFEIGAANRARGHEPARVGRLLQLSVQHLRTSPPLPIAS